MVAVTMLADCGLEKRRIFNRDDDCRNWNLLLNDYRDYCSFCKDCTVPDNEDDEIDFIIDEIDVLDFVMDDVEGDGGEHEVVDDYDVMENFSKQTRICGHTKTTKHRFFEGNLKIQRYIYVGLFDSEDAAARAYDKAVIECYRREVVTNFKTNSYEGNILPATHLDKSEEAEKFDDAKEVTFNMWGPSKAERSIEEFQSVLKNDGGELSIGRNF
ncbi:hypothetical protein L1987_15172 [Smallanthus sonchifolius]|uniref:Uncharacterized protein n=1 Tax=Smallanthus sonchifolius TaxID=185202 RepID=A0ACB9J707_9ASTR|nr:hypothetical protein L1987_15172 [Smallanthus sonchifolius]